MVAQQVEAEVPFEVTPDAMNVIGVILRIVVLDQKLRRLDSVIMRTAFLLDSRPCKVQIIAGFFDLV